jgi:dihydrofolate reductase
LSVAIISLIVAMDRNGLIGSAQGLPWRLPSDLKRFRRLTIGKPIIMGRKTLDQIGGPLRDRLNIVLTRQPEFSAPGCRVARSMEEAIEIARDSLASINVGEIMIIGGAEVYRQALPIVERVYLTVVEDEFAGNAWFPAEGLERAVAIVQDEHVPNDEKNPHGQRFLVLDVCEGGTRMRGLLEG